MQALRSSGDQAPSLGRRSGEACTAKRRLRHSTLVTYRPTTTRQVLCATPDQVSPLRGSHTLTQEEQRLAFAKATPCPAERADSMRSRVSGYVSLTGSASS